MEPYIKRKKLLEEKSGKLINSKQLNDDNGIVDKGWGPFPNNRNTLNNFKILQMRGD